MRKDIKRYGSGFFVFQFAKNSICFHGILSIQTFVFVVLYLFLIQNSITTRKPEKKEIEKRFRVLG
jgi:hypothetical protein